MHCLNRVKINLKRLQNMKLVVVVQAVRVQLHYLKNIGLARVKPWASLIVYQRL